MLHSASLQLTATVPREVSAISMSFSSADCFRYIEAAVFGAVSANASLIVISTVTETAIRVSHSLRTQPHPSPPRLSRASRRRQRKQGAGAGADGAVSSGNSDSSAMACQFHDLTHNDEVESPEKASCVRDDEESSLSSFCDGPFGAPDTRSHLLPHALGDDAQFGVKMLSKFFGHWSRILSDLEADRSGGAEAQCVGEARLDEALRAKPDVGSSPGLSSPPCAEACASNCAGIRSSDQPDQPRVDSRLPSTIGGTGEIAVPSSMGVPGAGSVAAACASGEHRADEHSEIRSVGLGSLPGAEACASNFAEIQRSDRPIVDSRWPSTLGGSGEIAVPSSMGVPGAGSDAAACASGEGERTNTLKLTAVRILSPAR